MAEQQSGATPAQATPAAATPPAQPAAPNAGTPPPATPAVEGVKIEGDKVVMDLTKYKNLERDAARGRSRKSPNADERREQRYSQTPAGNGDDDDPEKQELKTKLTTTEKENLQLKLQNKVRDLLESDDYKDLSPAAKRILKKNPLAVVDPRARNLDDAIADIQDWMDEDLSTAGASSVTPQPGTPGAQGQPPKETTPETPPVNGSQPAPAGGSQNENLEGKTGAARSTGILKNLFKSKGISK